MGEEKRNMRLSDQAAAEFARESADERESQRRELEEAAAKFTSPVELYEGATAQIALFVAVGILLLAIMFMAGTLQLSAKAICLVCGLLCLVFGIHVLMRRKNAVATLTPTGVLFSGSPRELPWEDVDDVDYQGAHSIVQMSAALFFHLREGIEPPALSGGRRVRYIKRKHAVVAQVMQFKGKNGKELMELLTTAHNAGVARALLKEMH